MGSDHDLTAFTISSSTTSSSPPPKATLRPWMAAARLIQRGAAAQRIRCSTSGAGVGLRRGPRALSEWIRRQEAWAGTGAVRIRRHRLWMGSAGLSRGSYFFIFFFRTTEADTKSPLLMTD